MVSVVEVLWKQAISTFTPVIHRSRAPHPESFEKLKTLADRITATDVKLDISLLSTNVDRHLGTEEPPVTYIEIYEDKNVTIGIFILKPGGKIPLHDHPNMYGILKVISGTAKIQCYDMLPNQPTFSHVINQQTFLAKKLPEIYVNESDTACVLTPTDRNMHEIESVDGPVAFLDILAPPYESHYLKGANECHYFREVDLQISNVLDVEEKNIAKLLNVPSPPDFWSKSAPYLGPPLRTYSEDYL